MRSLVVRTLLGSIAVSALLGIYAVLAGHFGDFEMKVLGTSVSVSVACLLAMGAFAGWDQPAARVTSRVGVATSLAGLALVIAGIWTGSNSEVGWKVSGSLAIVGGACALATLASLAKLPAPQAWLRAATHAVTALLVAALFAVIWGDAEIWRPLAILSILESAATLALVVVHVVHRAAPAAAGSADIGFCPYCGKRLVAPAGEISCSHCDAAFYLEVRAASPLPTAVARA